MTVVVGVVIVIAAGVPSGTEPVDKPASTLATQPHAEREGTASASDRTSLLRLEPAATKNTSTDRLTRTSPAVDRIKPSAVTTPSRPRTDDRLTASRSKPATLESITTEAENAEVVTITGCLHLDQQTFTLKDVSGSEVPTSRSWRFGFFRKQRASTIDVIDAGNSLQLQNHVGERVGATGTLEGRKLRARSLRTVSGSCS